MSVSTVYSIATVPDAEFCNGAETCDLTTNICVAGTTPCLTGQICDEGRTMFVSFVYSIATAPMPISATEPKPATSQPIPVWPVRHRASPGEICDETDDVCVVCLLDSDCADADFCNGAETCDLTTNTCVAGTSPCQPGESATRRTMFVSFVYSIATAPMPISATAPKRVISQPIPVWPVPRRASRENSATRRTMSVSFVYSIATAPMPTSATAPKRVISQPIPVWPVPRRASRENSATRRTMFVSFVYSIATAPMPIFCNGAETCDLATNTCVAGTTPCQPGELCDETDDVCVDCVVDSDCADADFCNGAETCDLATNTCVAGTTAVPAGRTLRRDGRCLCRFVYSIATAPMPISATAPKPAISRPIPVWPVQPCQPGEICDERRYVLRLRGRWRLRRRRLLQRCRNV